MAEQKLLNFREFPGYHGAHTQDQVPGAIANRSKVRKVASEPGDTHQDGASARVLGSFHHPMVVGFGYFVAFDDEPHLAVFVTGSRIERDPEDSDG